MSIKVKLEKDDLTVEVYPAEVESYTRDGWKKPEQKKKSKQTKQTEEA